MTHCRVAAPLVALLAGLPLVAQRAPASPGDPSVADLVERLRGGADQARVIVGIRRAGPSATAALADATLAAVLGRRPEALRFAQALAQVGHADGALSQLLAAIPRSDGEVLDALLHALGNGVLSCADAQQVGHVEDAVAAWAREGRCYSPSAEAPTFAWYEYVRLQQRLRLQRDGGGPEAARRALAALRASRETGMALLAAIAKPEDYPLYHLGAHGAHGQRETIEAAAELALQHGAVDLVRELARYLEHETPRPGEILVEHCAGIGENAPVDLPGVRLPTRWRRDDWRFAVARAVLALDPEQPARLHALRHLLHSPSTAERLETLAAARQWPGPWTAFVPDLVACLADDDRTVVRESLVTLGLAGEAARAAQNAIERLAAGDDRELAALARRVLDRLR